LEDFENDPFIFVQIEYLCSTGIDHPGCKAIEATHERGREGGAVAEKNNGMFLRGNAKQENQKGGYLETHRDKGRLHDFDGFLS
jgi:hypothetical protein